jgi:hypothetical protein
LKCAEKEVAGAPPFEPESPFVIVCEGWQDASFVCALLERLGVTNCDVTYPKKSDGGNGKDAIKKMVLLLAGRKPVLSGLAVIADADSTPEDSFKGICESFSAPYKPPPNCFEMHEHKETRTAIFLIPGRNKTGALEHLFLDAIQAVNPDGLRCVDALRECAQVTREWSENKIGKMRLAAYVATNCKNDPCCSPAYLWSSKNMVFEISNPVFKELSDFLEAFTAEVPINPNKHADRPM